MQHFPIKTCWDMPVLFRVLGAFFGNVHSAFNISALYIRKTSFWGFAELFRFAKSLFTGLGENYCICDTSCIKPFVVDIYMQERSYAYTAYKIN